MSVEYKVELSIGDDFPLDSNIQCRFPFPINFSQQLNKLVIRKRFEIDEEGLRITNLKPRSDY